MIKKILSIVIVLMLIFTAFPTTVFAAGSDIIHNNETGIPDKGLYKAILRELGKNKNGKFTKDEAAGIIKLNASNHDNKYINIKTIKGIENLTGLTQLYIDGNELTRLTGIENLTNLTCLSVSYNKLKNLYEIRNLNKLEELSVNSNKLTSLTGVENLTELSVLVASKNKLTNIPNLKKHTKLEPEYTYFQYNCINTKEFKEKLPSHLLKESSWLKNQIKFQNIIKTLKITIPKSSKKITKNTTKIVGKTQKGATVVILKPNGKKIKAVKANAKGIFTFKNLNLKKLEGKKITLQAYLVDGFYDERHNIKSIKLTVRNK